MTERRLPLAFGNTGTASDADQNDLIQKGAGGLWVTRSPIDLQVSNQTVRFELSMFPLAATIVSGLPAWVRAVTGPNTFGAWINSQTSSSNNSISFPLMLPPGATLVDVGVTIQGGYNGFNHSSEPSTRPHLSIREVNRSAGTSTEVFDGTFAAIGQAGYDAVHTVIAAASPTGLNVSSNLLPYVGLTDRTYVIVVQGESGSGALDSRLALHGIFADIQLTQLLWRL